MFCISVSFKKSPLPIRQKFAFLPEEQRQFLSFLREQKAVSGGVVLSTCNRSEIYVTGGKEALEAVEKGLFVQKGIDRERIKTDCLYYSGKKAVRHLFQVICGLDSMVLGEDEILHQVREAYQTAVLENAADGEIHIVFQEAIHCARLSKTGTRLSATPVSIGTLTANAVEDYLKLSDGVKTGKNGTVLVIGATGKIGSIVAKDLIAKGISVIGTQRKKHRGEEIFLAQKDKIILEDFDRRYQCISRVDAIVSATSSPHYTLTRGEYEKQDSKKKRLLVDLAVPYDIDRELKELQQVTLLDIDYFSDLSERNGNIRAKEAERAVGILGECVEETMKKLYIRDFFREWEKSGKEAEDWFWKMIYHLKKVLDSDMFYQVLCKVGKPKNVIRRI